MLAAPTRRIALALLLVCLAAGSARAASAPARLLPPYRPAVDEPAKTAEDRRFDALIDEWFARELAARPNWATGVGIHDYDAKLDETSQAAYGRRLERVRDARDRARGIEVDHLSPNRRLDQQIFVARMAEIQQLWADVEARMGDEFVLGEFHDRLLGMGRAPLSIIRQAFMDPTFKLISAGGPGAGSDFAR